MSIFMKLICETYYTLSDVFRFSGKYASNNQIAKALEKWAKK